MKRQSLKHNIKSLITLQMDIIGIWRPSLFLVLDCWPIWSLLSPTKNNILQMLPIKVFQRSRFFDSTIEVESTYKFYFEKLASFCLCFSLFIPSLICNMERAYGISLVYPCWNMKVFDRIKNRNIQKKKRRKWSTKQV